MKEEADTQEVLNAGKFDWALYALVINLLGCIEKMRWWRKIIFLIFFGESVLLQYVMLKEYCLKLGIPYMYAWKYFIDKEE